MTVGQGSMNGYASLVGVAFEDVFGTHVTAASFIEFNSESFQYSREKTKLESINTTRNFTRIVQGKEDITGSIEFDMNLGSDFFIKILKMAMGGTVGSSTLAAGAIAHTLYEGDGENNNFSVTSGTITTSLSFSVRKGGVISAGGTIGSHLYQFDGMRVNSLSIKGEVGSPVMISAELIGIAATSSSDSITASFATTLPEMFHGVKFYTTDSITNAAPVEEYIQSFELTINNNIFSDGRRLGRKTPDILPHGRREVSLKISQRWDTSTNYLRWNQNTMTACKFIIDSGQTLTAANSSYSMAIKLPACYVNNALPEIGGPEVIAHDVEFLCLQGSEAGYCIQMQVNNATNSYNNKG